MLPYVFLAVSAVRSSRYHRVLTNELRPISHITSAWISLIINIVKVYLCFRSLRASIFFYTFVPREILKRVWSLICAYFEIVHFYLQLRLFTLRVNSRTVQVTASGFFEINLSLLFAVSRVMCDIKKVVNFVSQTYRRIYKQPYIWNDNIYLLFHGKEFNWNLCSPNAVG